MVSSTNLIISSIDSGRVEAGGALASLAPDVRQIVVANVKLTVSVVSQSSTEPSSPSDHFVLLARWYGFWIIFAFVLHIFVGRFLSQSRNGTAEGPYSCRYRIPMGRSRAVLSSPPMLGEGHWSATVRISSSSITSGSSPLTNQAGTQGSLSINESDALTTNSHGCSTSQSPSNRTPSASFVPSGSAPYPSGQSPNTRKRRECLSGPARSKSHRRALRDAALDVFEPQPTETIPLAATLFAWTILPTPPSDTSSEFGSTSGSPTEATPLLATLYPGHGDLLVAPRARWFILVIAVTCKKYGVIDPEFDLAFLRTVFSQPKPTKVRFESLAEGDATLENIQAKLNSLYREAQETRNPFRLCVYLTGIGDGDSKMCLFGDKVVCEQELGSWTLGLRDQSTSSQCSSSVSAIMDFCRETMQQRDVVDDKLGLVWSSSVGRPASANACPLSNGLPMSCFPIALFSVANDIPAGSTAFGEAFRLRLEQLGHFLRFCYDGQHEANGRCKLCKGQTQKCPPPASQVPEWDSAGLDMLTALAELIKTEYPEDARKVSEGLTRRMGEQGFPVRTVGLGSGTKTEQL